MAKFRMRWRFFLSRRSRGRKALAIIALIAATLIAVWLALPGETRAYFVQLISDAMAALGAIQPTVLAAGVIVAFVVISFLLIALPGYRKQPYLTASPSLIPPVSVYVDAEGPLSTSSLRDFREYLIKRLDGRRADLLYFLDASNTASTDRFTTFYRLGFRLVDVPHNQTGVGVVKEAVDREISMHALERALIGPAGQQFIIVTGDGDYIPLIYRLLALGHSVHVWTTSLVAQYRNLATYLNFEVTALSDILGKPGRTVADNEVSPNARLREAVAMTVQAYNTFQSASKNDHDKRVKFEQHVREEAQVYIAGVGYGVGNWPKHWIDRLALLEVFQSMPNVEFPSLGSRSFEDAASSLLAMAYKVAQAAIEAAPKRSDGALSAHDVASVLEIIVSDAERADEVPFWELMKANRPKAALYVRYSLYMARALGIMSFQDVQSSRDVIKNPRLLAPRTPGA